ncbi:MAG: MurT ligase domain-containing protein [Methanobacteriaceae archaeon]|nr:MurT ligase domain-containing protein [Methanobacteriaceae archaeon]
MTSINTKLSKFIGKSAYHVAKKCGKNATALPGKVALTVKSDLLVDMGKKCDKIIVTTGSNGKTTTTTLLNHVLKGSYENVISNLGGSNMIQGVVTPFVVESKDHYDFGVFEVDEGSIPTVFEYITPDYFIITNFFRDQLDRYGETDNTIKMVHDAIKPETTLILNSNEPSLLQFDDLPNKKIYTNIEENQFSKHEIKVVENILCPNCGQTFDYEYVNYGNVGKFTCPNCGTKNHKPDYNATSINVDKGHYEFTLQNKGKEENYNLYLKGLYNVYNTIGVIAAAKESGMDYNTINERIQSFEYKQGRMETINYKNKDVTLVLSKNPVGLSEVFTTFGYDEEEKVVMYVMNSYAPDGIDVSWIWDADFEQVAEFKGLKKFYCVGTRAEDISTRVKYAGIPTDKIKVYPAKDRWDIKQAIEDILSEDVNAFITTSFTALPETRRLLIEHKENEK